MAPFACVASFSLKAIARQIQPPEACSSGEYGAPAVAGGKPLCERAPGDARAPAAPPLADSGGSGPPPVRVETPPPVLPLPWSGGAAAAEVVAVASRPRPCELDDGDAKEDTDHRSK